MWICVVLTTTNGIGAIHEIENRFLQHPQYATSTCFFAIDNTIKEQYLYTIEKREVTKIVVGLPYGC